MINGVDLNGQQISKLKKEQRAHKQSQMKIEAEINDNSEQNGKSKRLIRWIISKDKST